MALLLLIHPNFSVFESHEEVKDMLLLSKCVKYKRVVRFLSDGEQVTKRKEQMCGLIFTELESNHFKA